MFNSTVLEVAIGMIFCFSSVSLLVSQIQEAIAAALGLRASSLLQGVKQLLNDPQFNGLALAVYQHALVNPRDPGTTTSADAMKAKPSYIESSGFARAFIDSIQQGAQSAQAATADLGTAIAKISDPQIRTMLEGMYQRANKSASEVERQLAQWFDGGMQRVGGAYKRRVQLMSFAIGLAIAIGFNVDSVQLFESLWARPAYTAALTTGASAAAGQLHVDALDTLTKLPVGWTKDAGRFDPLTYKGFAQMVGWLVTAISVLFGAPFWFDLLQRVVQLRGTGKKPGE